MPFTPYHLGPALAFGLPFRRFIHTPTFIIANLIVDVEPFIILMFNFNLPLHWILHSLWGATLLGLLTAWIMYLLKEHFETAFKTLKLKCKSYLPFKSYVVAGVSGAIFHVMLDYPLYRDIKPLYPLTYNPLYNPAITGFIYRFCTYAFIVGLLEYIIILLKR